MENQNTPTSDYLRTFRGSGAHLDLPNTPSDIKAKALSQMEAKCTQPEKMLLKRIDFIQGDQKLQNFPISLLKELQKYCRRHGSNDLEGATNSPARDLYSDSQGRLATFIHPASGEILHVARYSYGARRVITVAQQRTGVDLNHGRPFIIRGGYGGLKEEKCNGKWYNTLRFKIWDINEDMITSFTYVLRKVDYSDKYKDAAEQELSSEICLPEEHARWFSSEPQKSEREILASRRCTPIQLQESRADAAPLSSSFTAINFLVSRTPSMTSRKRCSSAEDGVGNDIDDDDDDDVPLLKRRCLQQSLVKATEEDTRTIGINQLGTVNPKSADAGPPAATNINESFRMSQPTQVNGDLGVKSKVGLKGVTFVFKETIDDQNPYRRSYDHCNSLKKLTTIARLTKKAAPGRRLAFVIDDSAYPVMIGPKDDGLFEEVVAASQFASKQIGKEIAVLTK